jgi:hypothetical protein
MVYGAALIFDEPSESALRGVWQALADAGLPSFMLGIDYPPHLTLLLAEEMDVPRLRATIHDWARDMQPFDLSFPALSLFRGAGEGVIYLSPLVNRHLLDVHESFWTAALPSLRRVPEYYRPGLWVPHVTIGFNIPRDQAMRSMEALWNVQSPTTARVAGVQFGAYAVEGGSRLENVYFTPPRGRALSPARSRLSSVS